MYKNTFVFLLIGAVVVAAVLILLGQTSIRDMPEHNDLQDVACTKEARQCPDGSFVSRTGLNCEFSACPELPAITDELQASIDAKVDLIRVKSPYPGTTVDNPLAVSGEARGYWYFEGSFPLRLLDGEGTVIGHGFATANGEWMTAEFVPFTGTVSFVGASTTPGDTGSIIFEKDNPSGLPEHSDELTLPVTFK